MMASLSDPNLGSRGSPRKRLPDGRHFILDWHPDHPGVAIAAGFSGHGYKFCSVVGAIMADLAQDGRTRHDIEFFRLKRFATAP